MPFLRLEQVDTTGLEVTELEVEARKQLRDEDLEQAICRA